MKFFMVVPAAAERAAYYSFWPQLSIVDQLYFVEYIPI
jgi:hypothetical protein